MRISFQPEAWEDLLYWQRTDKRQFKRITALIKDVQRSPFEGIGKPEPLKGDLTITFTPPSPSEDRYGGCG